MHRASISVQLKHPYITDPQKLELEKNNVSGNEAFSSSNADHPSPYVVGFDYNEVHKRVYIFSADLYDTLVFTLQITAGQSDGIISKDTDITWFITKSAYTSQLMSGNVIKYIPTTTSQKLGSKTVSEIRITLDNHGSRHTLRYVTHVEVYFV